MRIRRLAQRRRDAEGFAGNGAAVGGELKPEKQQMMKVEMVKITPETAREMLRLNTGNRPANKHHVAVLAREMKMGRWKVNGDTICVNGKRLIDGQHRLMAVVESGCTIETLLVEGVDADVFDTKDVGRRRSASDTLAVRGEVDTNKLAAALCVVDRYMTGRMMQTVRYTNTEVEELLEKYPGVRESIRKTRETKRLVPCSVLTACHYLFAQRDKDAADQFVVDLIGGHNLHNGDPVYVLRERLMNNAMAKAKLQSSYIMALLVKAWNHRRDENTIRHLRFRQEGDKPESFPSVQ